jgi:hypothetical protein
MPSTISMRVAPGYGKQKADPPLLSVEVKKKAESKEPWDYCDVLRQVPPDEAFNSASQKRVSAGQSVELSAAGASS